MEIGPDSGASKIWDRQEQLAGPEISWSVTLGWVLRLCPQNVKPPHKSIFDSKAMLDHLIDKEIPFEIVHHLVHFDSHLPFGAFRKRYRLDVRIYGCPLARPVAADSFAPVDVPSFHAVCPNDIFMQGCEHRLDVASVEEIIESPKDFHVIRQIQFPWVLDYSGP